jgi:hypothetical protein
MDTVIAEGAREADTTLISCVHSPPKSLTD